MPRVKDYLNYFRLQRHPALFREETVRGLDAVERLYGDLESNQVIYEIRPNREERGLDFSIGVPTPDAPSEDYWLELDEVTWRDRLSEEPCRFINAEPVLTGPEHAAAREAFYQAALIPMLGEARFQAFRPMLERTLSILEGRCAGLFQIGSMNARGESDRLRIFTDDLSKEGFLSVLEDIGWAGDRNLVAGYLDAWDPYFRKTGYILDFDISTDGFSGKIGLNTNPFHWQKDEDAFLKLLVEQGLCLPEKARALRDWVGVPPLYSPAMRNNISHFKLAFDTTGILGIKAYLRQINAYGPNDYRMFFRPAQMNLELTTRCPLHCPQCYVSLNTGKELPLDEALYWLREGAKTGVQCVNLSGGETLCYPYLTELIRECKRLNMSAAVALSGAYATEEKLREMIEAGVAEIYVSLNGSTEEVNARSRDGYALAIRTLEILRTLHFPEVHINWVMHSNNADDLENMLALCERYDVKRLIILGFKPNSAHELPSFPTEEQIRQAARTMKAYKGPVQVEAESCFSQLRAVWLNGFLLNRNRGVFRGCGAGRDGVSVNVDGKLTPCRHLDVAEDTRSMTDYWENSPFLKRLRETEECRETPCKGCAYEKYCLPCSAVGMKLHGALRYGMEECPLAGNGA